MISLEMVFYKDAAANGMTVWQYCLHFIMVCTIWGLGSFAVYKLSKGKKLLPGTDHARKRFGISGISILFLLVAAGILFMSFDAEEMRLHLKPLSELRYFLRTYGRTGISVFLLQHLYYLLESALILFIIVFGQEAGESLFPVRRTSLIPWGGIFCALTWGMLHGLTKYWETALFSLILSTFFVLCYFAANRRMFPAYLAIALIFLL